MSDRYDELRAALAKASPAPWKAESTVYEHMISEVRCILPGSEHGIAQVWNGENGYADACFMALARRDVDLMLAELDDLRAALARKSELYDDAMAKWSEDVAEFGGRYKKAEAERDSLLAALKPFAREAGAWLDRTPDETIVLTMGPSDDGPSCSEFTLGDLRCAAALTAKEG